MEVEITKSEAWRILDAIIAYKKDYYVDASVTKTIKNVEKKLKKAIRQDDTK
jgi:hypothetical protein